MVYWDGKVDMACVAGARLWTKIAGSTSIREKAVGKPQESIWLDRSISAHKWKDIAYIESPHDPRAGSYKPPRTGLSNVSKVLSFSIFLTDIAWISSLVRKVNSTRSTEDETGCEIFMVA